MDKDKKDAKEQPTVTTNTASETKSTCGCGCMPLSSHTTPTTKK